MTAILAFDTGTDRCSVALRSGGHVISEDHATGSDQPSASAVLLPAIERTLAEAGLGYADLDAIAFGRGPGAFTGLRTSAAVAQGLALGAAKPVLPVPSLLALAEEARRARGGDQPFRVWAVLDARMGEVYAALCETLDGVHWQTLDGPLLAAPDALVDRWPSDGALRPSSPLSSLRPGSLPAPAASSAWMAPSLPVAALPSFALAGSGIAVLGHRVPPGVALFPDAAPNARAVLALAEGAWQRGEAVDAALAVPLYLRDKVAETEVERAAARAAKVAA